MSKFNLRLTSWWALALILFALIALIAPQQLSVTAYKLSLVSIAAIVGYHLDRALFPYASPGSYLKVNWRKGPHHKSLNNDSPEYPIINGMESVFAAVLLRRAIIVTACILGVTLGL